MTGDEDALALGVDLGATKIEIALVGRDGRIRGRARRPTNPDKGAAGVIADLVEAVRDEHLATADAPILGVGVGVAGQVDPATGTVRYGPNLRWREVPLRDELESRLGRPVMVMNDVQAITYGEWTHGAGRGVDDLVCLFVGTGVGGGIVSAGRLVLGASGNAGELGHLVIERDGPPCTCGNRGCLEALTGGWAIARAARERIAADPREGAPLLRLAGGALDAVTAETVADAFRERSPLAEALVEETGRALGAGLASIANAFNPALLVLGGGVLDGLPELLAIAEREARARALAAASRPLRIQRSALGADAGAIGAAARIRDGMSQGGAPASRAAWRPGRGAALRG